MSVHTAKLVKADVKELEDLARAGDYDDFISSVSIKFNCAADLWLNPKDGKKLMQLVADGQKIAVITTDGDDQSDIDNAVEKEAAKKNLTLFAGYVDDDEELYYEGIFLVK